MHNLIKITREGSRLCLYFHYGGFDETVASGTEDRLSQLA